MSKYNNSGAAWFNANPKSDKSPTFMGSSEVKKTGFWVSMWLNAPEDNEEIAKACKVFLKVLKKHSPKCNKGKKPLFRITFKKQ